MIATAVYCNCYEYNSGILQYQLCSDSFAFNVFGYSFCFVVEHAGNLSHLCRVAFMDLGNVELGTGRNGVCATVACQSFCTLIDS